MLKNKDYLKLILAIILFIGVIVACLIFDKFERNICESNKGTYIQENMGLGKGKCVYD